VEHRRNATRMNYAKFHLLAGPSGEEGGVGVRREGRHRSTLKDGYALILAQGFGSLGDDHIPVT
jgi:hypothetical protein